MANVTIPNLPQVTATTDLDILVITDSGETTTSKITKADLFAGIGGGKLVDANLTGANNLYIDGYLPTYTDAAGTYNNLNLGFFTGSNITGNNHVVIGGTDTVYIYGGDHNTIINGAFHQIQSTSNYSSIIGGYGGQANGDYTAVVGGRDCKVNGTTSNYCGIFGGQANTINNGALYSAICGGNNNTLDNADHFFIGGGSGNNVSSQTDRGAIVGGYGTSIAGACDYTSHYASQFVNILSTTYSHSLGTHGGNIAGGSHQGLLFGESNNIYANQEYNYILGSWNSFIGNMSTPYAAVSGNTIIGGQNVLNDTHSDVTTIGVKNYTADTDNVVVVPQLVVTEYSTLNYADDTAAAAGGVPLGGIYHNAGALRIRIS